MHGYDLALFVASILLILGVLAGMASGALGVPSLLAFLGLGMLAGSDGVGGIHFTDAGQAQMVGVVALTFILFSGGMGTHWADVKPIVRSGLLLATIGVVTTASIVGFFAFLFLGFSLTEGFLLGAIIASTDAAAVFGLFRSSTASLNRKVQSLLELESGSNDPIAIFLTIGLTDLAAGKIAHLGGWVPVFAREMVLGALLGYGFGKFGVIVMQRIRLPFEALYSIFSVALALLSYSGSALVGGNGFLAVYVAGLTFGHGKFEQREDLQRYHDAISWLMQIVLFITLGLLVFPHQLPAVVGSGMLVALVLIFVARPVSVFLSLIGSGFSARAKLLVSWAGLRGAVPIVLATYPLIANLPKATETFNIVFFVVLISSLLQGTTVPWLTQKFGLAE
jgi:potassium/hydrogen antiporter